MFLERVKHYHPWLRSAIPLKTQLGQISSDCIRIQGPTKRPSSGRLFQFTSLLFGLATAPQVFTMIVKEVKLMAFSRGLRLHQYLDDWLIRSQSQEEAQVNTHAVVDLTQSLGWIINQEKSELKPTQVFSFVGYEYHLDSALVKPTQERWLKLQDLILRLKSKHVLTARCLISLIGLLASTEKMVPEGCLYMRPFQFHLKEHWRYPQSLQPPSLDRNDFCTPRLVAESCKHDERLRPSSQRPQYPILYRRLKRSLGRSLRSKFYHSAEICALLWKIMTCCHHYHITLKARHIPGCVNVMADLLSRSNQVQSTEWSLHPQVFKQICQTWFTPHVDLFATHLNHKLPLYVSPIPDPKAWDVDALNIN